MNLSNQSSTGHLRGFAAALQRKRSGVPIQASAPIPEFDALAETNKSVQAASERFLDFIKDLLRRRLYRNTQPAIVFSYDQDGKSLLQREYPMPTRNGKRIVSLRDDVSFYGHQIGKGLTAFRDKREKLPVKHALDRVNEELTKYNFFLKDIGNFQLGIIDISMPEYDMNDVDQADIVHTLNQERRQYWADWWTQRGDGNGSRKNFFAIIPLEFNPDEYVNLWHRNTRIVIPDGHPIGTIEPDFLQREKAHMTKISEEEDVKESVPDVTDTSDFPPLSAKSQ